MMKIVTHPARYALPLVAVGAAFALRFVLEDQLGMGLPTFITFYPAIMFVALVAGSGPGLLATAVTAIGADYWIISPSGLFIYDRPIDIASMVLFVLMGVVMSLFGGRYRKNRDQLEIKVEQRTKELRDSEERFRAVAEALPHLLWTTDPAGSLEWLNGRWYDYTGQKPGSTEGWESVTHPDDLPRTIEKWNEAVRGGTVYENEVRVCRHDGICRWFLVRAWPLRNSEGAVVRWFGSNTDIHDLKEARMELQNTRDLLERRVIERTAELDRARAAAVAERQRLYDVLETLPVYVILLTTDYHVAFDNRFFRERFGEHGGRTCYEYLFNRTEPCETCETFTVLQTGKPHHWEWTGPDGRNYDIHDFLFTDANGERLIMEMGIDITERKTAEEALRRHRDNLEAMIVERTRELRDSEERMRSTLDNMMEGCQIIGFDWRYLYVNPSAAAQGRSERLDLLGRTMMEKYPGIEQTDMFARLKECMEKRIPQHLENEFVYPDGSSAWFDLSVQPAPEGVFILSMDISERKAIEDKLARLASFPEKNPNPIIELDYNGAITYVNPRTRELFPGIMDEGMGHPLLAGIDWILAKLRDGQVQSPIIQEIVAGGEFYHQTVDVVPESRLVRLYTFNISERKRMENEIKRVNENLDQFAYIASHDLQEPLRIMSSYSQLLGKRYKNRLDADANDFIGFIVDAAFRMQTLINDLLTYSRTGHKGAQLTEFNCENVVRRVIENLAVSIESKRGKVIHEALPVIRAHRPSIMQLFQNLISNALKFQGPEPPLVRLGAAKNGPEWVFSVSDNGIGIEPDYQERVFQIFQRLHSRDKYEGTGIGLTICKRIVENHGGRIWVESEPGRGSTFYFTIPG